jgi:pentatricopeptide repeat protein
MAWFDKMQAAGVKPNEITYTWLIKASVLARQYDQPAGLLERMQADGLRINAEFARNLFYVYLRANLLDEAEKWLETYLVARSDKDQSTHDSKDNDFETTRYCIFAARIPRELVCDLIGGLAVTGDAERTIAWFRRFEEGGGIPPLETINAVIETLCRADMLGEAVRWLESIPTRGFSLAPDSLVWYFIIFVV